MAPEPVLVGSITGIWTYLLSIDWEEPWLWVLMIFHVVCAMLTLTTLVFNYHQPQIALFLLYLSLSYCSEYLNEWAASNYKSFSREQYFDSQGLFVTLTFSLPLLLNVLVIVVFWMWDVTKLLIGLKKVKVQQRQKLAKNQSVQDKAGEKDSAEDLQQNKKDD